MNRQNRLTATILTSMGYTMGSESAEHEPRALVAQLAELQQENETLRQRLLESESAAKAVAHTVSERERKYRDELDMSRSETAKAEADLRRSDAQIGRADQRYQRNANNDRTEILSAEGIIAALQSVQTAVKEGETRMRALLRSAADFAVLETDVHGRITFWNAGAEALLGWTAEEALRRNVSMLFTEEDREAHEPERERQVALTKGRSDTERWHIRKDGSRFYAHERVIPSIDDQRVRFLKILRNRSEEHANEEARYASEEQMRLILDSATDYAIFTLDRDGNITTWNSGAERLLGYKTDDIVGQKVGIVFTPEDREKGAPEVEISRALNDGRAQDERWHMRKDGSRFWGSGLMLPLKAEGTPGFLKIMRDDTARHRADEMNRLLIGELNHRVKNTLAVVQAIAKETLKVPAAQSEMQDALSSRLGALARSHDILARDNWEGASLAEVINRTLLPFLIRGNPEDRLVAEGPDVRLSPNTALSLGMGFHELATNAAKYGALSVPDGTVEVRWRDERAEGGGVRLLWREQNGPAVSPPTRKGFGSRLLERALAYEMNGDVSMHYNPDGLRFEISIPVTALQDNAP